jgi:formylglycine-generating enzyme required for sulfatase activity
MARVGPGVYQPLYPASPSERTVRVAAFWLDVTPVTNEAFLAFVLANPEWRRDRVKRLFADPGYLSHWEHADALGATVRSRAPVTNVSWFAAKAYCASRHARLPTEREWELAAAASDSTAAGERDSARAEKILAWYSERTEPSLRDVGATKPNSWGIRDLYGLVWEWVYDFGASLVTTDSRERGEVDKNRFCGGAGADARDPSDYATFMRIAFRSSLEAHYTTSSLGFRCAEDAK